MNNESTDLEEDNEDHTETDSQKKDGSLEELAGELLGVNLNSKSTSDVSLDDLDWGELEFAPTESRKTESEEEKISKTEKSNKNEKTIVQSDNDDSDLEDFVEPVIASDEDDDPLAAWGDSAEDWNWGEKKQKPVESNFPQTDLESRSEEDDEEEDEEVTVSVPQDAVETASSSHSLSSEDADPETAEDFVSEYNDDNPFGLGLFEDKMKSSDRPSKRSAVKKQIDEKVIDLNSIKPDETFKAEENDDEYEEVTEFIEDGDDFGSDLNLSDEKSNIHRKKKAPAVKKTSSSERSKSSERSPKKKTTDAVSERRNPQHTNKDQEATKSDSTTKTDYRDIPSWEEAISYLLKPSLVNSEKDDSSSGRTPSPKKQPHQSSTGTKTAPRKRKRRR